MPRRARAGLASSWLWAASSLRLLATALLISACTPSIPPGADLAPSDDVIIYVIERGWHTDIGLPVAEVAGDVARLERRFPGVRFLTFGFGERQFLLSRQTTTVGMLTALLPSPSALLVTALAATPEEAFGQQHVVILHVSRIGLGRIETMIWQELEQSPAGEPMALADGPYPGSLFYAARSTYDAFHTCNTWTAAAMRAAGLPVQSAGVLFVGQVMEMARSIAVRQASMRHG